MKRAIFNLLLLIFCIIIWVLNPWPFNKSFNSSKTHQIQKTQMVRGGFDPLQRRAKNLLDLKKNPIEQQIRKPEQQIGKPEQPTGKPEQPTSEEISFSNSNKDSKLEYRPMAGSNPGGSGNDFDENLPDNENSNEVISDPGFWDSIQTLNESDEEEDPNPVEAEKSSSPTGKLTREAVQNNDITTKMISPTEFNDWEGESRTIKSKELKKTVFAKGYDAGVVPNENLVECPVQNDLDKFQRKRCGLITDQSVEKMKDKLIDLTTSRKDGRVKLKLDMPFYDTEKAIGYIDLNTGDCAFYHEDSGKFWSYVKYDKNGVRKVLTDSDWVKYAKPLNSNSEL